MLPQRRTSLKQLHLHYTIISRFDIQLKRIWDTLSAVRRHNIIAGIDIIIFYTGWLGLREANTVATDVLPSLVGWREARTDLGRAWRYLTSSHRVTFQGKSGQSEKAVTLFHKRVFSSHHSFEFCHLQLFSSHSSSTSIHTFLFSQFRRFGELSDDGELGPKGQVRMVSES